MCHSIHIRDIHATKNTTIDGQVIPAGELVVKAQYIFFMHENTNFDWKQQPLQYTIIVPTRKILHISLDFIIIIHVQDIPKNLCSRNQAKK